MYPSKSASGMAAMVWQRDESSRDTPSSASDGSSDNVESSDVFPGLPLPFLGISFSSSPIRRSQRNRKPRPPFGERGRGLGNAPVLKTKKHESGRLKNAAGGAIELLRLGRRTPADFE
ncbi:hypothetical protein B7486_16530 [cyanobacterium TDX16]|nr:hypothetical protein B7486_16530 [cyanobacterium TDX16]